MNLLKDDLNKLFFKFLIPAISSAVAVAGYSLVDTIAIGQGVGADGTAACAVVLPIFSIANFIALLCGIGGCVLRSQAKGEGNEEKGNACFTSAVCMVAVITIVVWIVGNLIQNDFYRLCGAYEVLMPYSCFLSTFIVLSPTMIEVGPSAPPMIPTLELWSIAPAASAPSKTLASVTIACSVV